MKLKTVNIKGKEYVEVNERIRAFRHTLHHWTLDTEILELNEKWVVMKAIIRDDKGRLVATGTAYEMANSSFINKTSYIENCETSAWGRALGNLGIGIDSSIATAEEVQNAISNQETEQGKPVTDKDVLARAERRLTKCKTYEEFDDCVKRNWRVWKAQLSEEGIAKMVELGAELRREWEENGGVSQVFDASSVEDKPFLNSPNELDS